MMQVSPVNLTERETKPLKAHTHALHTSFSRDIKRESFKSARILFLCKRYTLSCQSPSGYTTTEGRDSFSPRTSSFQSDTKKSSLTEPTMLRVQPPLACKRKRRNYKYAWRYFHDTVLASSTATAK